MRDESVASCSAGRLQPGQLFVVTEVDYRGTSVGDSNGSGEFTLVVFGEVIARSLNSHLPTSGVWRGGLEVFAGAGKDVYLEVRNSSTSHTVVSGYVTGSPFGTRDDGKQADVERSKCRSRPNQIKLPLAR